MRAMVSLAGRAHAVEGDVRFYVHPDAVALHRAVVRAVLGHPSRAGTVARHPALLGLELRVAEHERLREGRGRVAEELIFGYDKVSSGASGDIQMATGLARSMVTQWGMSDKMGPLQYEEQQGGRDSHRGPVAGEEVLTVVEQHQGHGDQHREQDQLGPGRTAMGQADLVTDSGLRPGVGAGLEHPARHRGTGLLEFPGFRHRPNTLTTLPCDVSDEPLRARPFTDTASKGILVVFI